MIFYHAMSTEKIAITIEEPLLAKVDKLVRDGLFPNRSRAIAAAIKQLTRDERHARFRRELARLNPKEERAMAAEFGDGGVPWPEY
jgi:Arc/MetJ-type ribon-helix-helix transcriptional regulator